MVFNSRYALDRDRPLNLPCGQCIGCRLKYSAHWAARCWHEASLWPHNSFLTLTFADNFLPPDGSVHVSDCQWFMRRLRDYLYNPRSSYVTRYRLSPKKVRMAYCGEYGDLFGRPHYHFILFNHDFSEDRYLLRVRDSHKVYRSPTLERLWPWGHSEIGNVTFDSAAYVARYITKKINGPLADDHYLRVNLDTGEILPNFNKEFFNMSRRPGIGKGWFDKYHSDVYPSDEVIVDGRKISPPKFYDSQFEIIEPDLLSDLKSEREERARKQAWNFTSQRLRVREQCKKASISTLQRRFEK